MKGRTKNQPRKSGRFASKDTPPKVMLGFCADPSTTATVEQLAEEYFKGVKSAAMDFLVLSALQELGRPVEGVIIPRIPGLNAPEEEQSAAGNGNTQVMHSSINANTADNAMSATQIGNANRNVNVKKNHAEPARTSKRRK